MSRNMLGLAGMMALVASTASGGRKGQYDKKSAKRKRRRLIAKASRKVNRRAA